MGQHKNKGEKILLRVKSAKKIENNTILKTATICFAFVLLFSIIMTTVKVNAAEVQTFMLISVAPNPVGVGQIVFINPFLSKPPVSGGMGGDGSTFEGLTVEVTKPDGTKQTLGPYKTDETGGAWDTYIPANVGTYSFQAFYPGGQTLYGFGVPYDYLGSESEIVELTVQEEPIKEYSSPPLPTEYWSRPIYSTNYGWAQLGGHWFGLAAPAFASTGQYDATGNLNAYSPAPNTGHILWTKPTAFGGQVGAPYDNDQETQYASSSIAMSLFEPIVINGVLYYAQYPTITSTKAKWIAVDLRTGDTLWEKDPPATNDDIRMGQVLSYHTKQEFGSVPYLWSLTGSSRSIFGWGGELTFNIWDPMTGIFLFNITSARNMNFIMDFDGTEQGTILGYYTNSGNLTLWNSTKAMAYPNGFTGYYASTIRPSGTINFTAGNEWSVEVPAGMSIGRVTQEVILMRNSPTPPFIGLNPGYQETAGYDAKTGAKLWGPLNQTLPKDRDISVLAGRDGYYVLHDKDLNQAWGYSLTNGQQVWGPVDLPGNAWSHISRAADIAYDKIYIWDFGGYVNALDLETGEIEWTFTRGSSGYDAPYGTYPLWHFGTHSIADGKLFLSEGSMYNPPLHPGAQRLAIDCETGELVWSILSYSGRCPGAIADGMLVEWNSYDNQIYTFGKGPTKTMVSAMPKVTLEGESVLIEGMVIDKSPGTNNPDREARFPNGVPAIADENMSVWMEYVYMQQPKPADATGVEVTLSVLDPNNNKYEIGMTTSDANGMYKLKFVPPVSGEYSIMAEFLGSESYYGSMGQTAILVDPAPIIPPEPTPTPGPQTETFITGSTIAILAGIAVAIFLILRKK